MGKNYHDFEVDGKKYTTTHFPVEFGLELGAKLSKHLVEPSLSKFAEMKDQDVGLGAASIGAITAVLKDLPPKEVGPLAKDLMSTCKVNGATADLDLHFSGEYVLLFKVLKEIVAFQFKDVFSVLSDLIPEGLLGNLTDLPKE
jgi:hypothetical protein